MPATSGSCSPPLPPPVPITTTSGGGGCAVSPKRMCVKMCLLCPFLNSRRRRRRIMEKVEQHSVPVPCLVLTWVSFLTMTWVSFLMLTWVSFMMMTEACHPHPPVGTLDPTCAGRMASTVLVLPWSHALAKTHG